MTLRCQNHKYLCPLTVYHGENKLIFNELMMGPLCRTTPLGGCLQCQLTETTVRGQTCHSTRTHFPDSGPTSLCSFSLRSNKYQFYSLRFDPIRAPTHDLPYSRRARQPLCHQCGPLIGQDVNECCVNQDIKKKHSYQV